MDFRPETGWASDLLTRGLEEAAPVIGFGKVDWVADDNRGLVDAACNGASRLFSEDEPQNAKRQNDVLELYDDVNLSLYRYLRGLGLSEDEAEDVIQEAFLRLVGHLNGNGGVGNLRSWLFQVAHNCSMDIHRANRRNHIAADPASEMTDEPVDPKANPEWVYLQKEQMKHVMTAISKLTPGQRNSILLRAEGLRYFEIASVLGVSEQRAIYLVKRGLMRLAGGL